MTIKTILVLGLAVGLIGFFAQAVAAEDSDLWITMCHHEEGAVPQTVEVPEADVEHHAAHGDYFGPCSTTESTPIGKVTICHLPPGNRGNEKTLRIDATSVSDHLSHGDFLGPCI